MASSVFSDKIDAIKSRRRLLDSLTTDGDVGGNAPVPAKKPKKERAVFRRDPVTGKTRISYEEE